MGYASMFTKFRDFVLKNLEHLSLLGPNHRHHHDHHCGEVRNSVQPKARHLLPSLKTFLVTTSPTVTWTSL